MEFIEFITEMVGKYHAPFIVLDIITIISFYILVVGSISDRFSKTHRLGFFLISVGLVFDLLFRANIEGVGSRWGITWCQFGMYLIVLEYTVLGLRNFLKKGK